MAVETVALIFLAGLTVGGTAATLFELWARQTVGFRAPFVSPRRLGRSALVTLAAGPFMLGNDALAAHRAGLISATALLACGLAALLWVMAGGAALVALAAKSGASLG